MVYFSLFRWVPGYLKIGLDCLVPNFHLLITNDFLTISTKLQMSALNLLNTVHKKITEDENFKVISLQI